MTEDEADLLHELKEQYWLDFSKLVASYIRKVPEHLSAELAERLQESSSVYGSKFIEVRIEGSPFS